MGEPIIVNAARTPVGKAKKGSLVERRPDDLAAAARDATSAPRAQDDLGAPGQLSLYDGCHAFVSPSRFSASCKACRRIRFSLRYVRSFSASLTGNQRTSSNS